MNQIIFGGLAFCLALFLWALGKKPKQTFREFQSKDYVSEIAQSQISLVNDKKINSQFSENNLDKFEWTLPSSERERVKLRNKLFQLISSNPGDRLLAVSIASRWGHSSIRPIIRRGLKDSESKVIKAAAAGIRKFNYTSKKIDKNHSKARLPLNVFLMR